MEYMLSYFVERFGKNSHCREDIYSESSLRELDKFTMQFKDSRALREYFKEEMDIFKEKFAEQIDAWEKLHPDKKNNGAIYANCLLDNVGLITIAIMYAGDDMVPDLVAYNNISNLLEKDENFTRFLNEKRYLLKLIDIQNETVGTDSSLVSTAEEYENSHNPRSKYHVINGLIAAMKKMSEEERYFYFRALVNLCDLRHHMIYLANGSTIDCYNYDGKGQTMMGEVALYTSQFVGYTTNIEDKERYKERDGKKYV